MSMFFGPSTIKLDTFQKQKFFSSFLFNNSFNTSGFNNLINTSSNNFNLLLILKQFLIFLIYLIMI